MVYNVESFAQIDHNNTCKEVFSIASSHSSVILIRMVSQEWLALKPDWHLYSRSWLVRKSMKCLQTCFSRIFEMTGRTDIGLWLSISVLLPCFLIWNTTNTQKKQKYFWSIEVPQKLRDCITAMIILHLMKCYCISLITIDILAQLWSGNFHQ